MCYIDDNLFSDLEPLEKSAVRILGDQASDGKCFGFSFDDSGTSRYYICCNNCYKSLPSFTPVCDGLTYQRGSSPSYCNECGVDKGTTTSLFKSEFYCGGCSGQDFVNQSCAATWVNKPATCWVFVSCMKTICVNMFEEFGTLSNCGNGYCNIDETSANCPIDCCFQKNASCTWGSECLPTCCGETSCCGKSSGDMVRMEIGAFVLILMVCCNLYQGRK